jgi:hypothetical protein
MPFIAAGEGDTHGALVSETIRGTPSKYPEIGGVPLIVIVLDPHCFSSYIGNVLSLTACRRGHAGKRQNKC